MHAAARSRQHRTPLRPVQWRKLARASAVALSLQQTCCGEPAYVGASQCSQARTRSLAPGPSAHATPRAAARGAPALADPRQERVPLPSTCAQPLDALCTCAPLRKAVGSPHRGDVVSAELRHQLAQLRGAIEDVREQCGVLLRCTTRPGPSAAAATAASTHPRTRSHTRTHERSWDAAAR